MTYTAQVARNNLGDYLYLSMDYSSDINNFRLYANRVNADGSFPPGWGIGGVRFSSDSGFAGLVSACSDEVGGYYIAWDELNGPASTRSDVFLLHLNADAQIEPGWPTGGLQLEYGYGNEAAFAIPDGQGGVIVVAENLETTGQQHYAYHVNPDGLLAWPNVSLLDARPVGNQLAVAISDGQGGAYAVMNFFSSGSESNLSVQRMGANGTIPPGWNPNGNQITAVGGPKFVVNAVSDGGSGVFIGWIDYRTFGTYYLQHLRGDGTRAPGWPINGIPATTSPNLQTFGNIAADGTGGVYCVIHDGYASRTLLTHISGAGVPAPGWPASGVDAMPEIPGGVSESYGVIITPDGDGGAIAGWSSGTFPPYSTVVMLTRMGPNEIVANELSLVSTQATPQTVTLHWFSGATPEQPYVLQRMAQGGEWTSLATVLPDGTGNLIYEDRTMLAGRRYGYRLLTTGATAHVASPETWVDVPAAFRFALAGARPNPAPRSGMSVAFSLEQNLPAALEMFDLSGRRVMMKDVGVLGAGEHVLRLGSEAQLSPGIFWLSLTQGGNRATARVVVVES